MELITLPEHAADDALCDSVRAVFHLQSQALKAALAQVDALQQQVDALRDGSQDAGEAHAAVLVGRLVKDAKEQPQNTNAAGGVQMVANPGSAQLPAGGAGMV